MNLKLLIFPAITVLLIVAILGVTFLNKKPASAVAKGNSGLIYADSFTDNSARHEWQLGADNDKVVTPTLVNDSLYFSGNGVTPCSAMLKYQLPEKFDLYFTADIARRGGDGRDPTITFTVTDTGSQRYQIWLSENTIKLTYNYSTKIAVKKAEGLVGGKAHSFKFSVNGANIKIYFNGAKEPILDYTASGEYASFAQARYFGVGCYSYEFYLDNLVITNGVDYIPITDLRISGRNNRSDIVGIGMKLQMMAYINPSNPTDSSLLWSVSDPELASITQDGLITSKGYGTITVTARTRNDSGITAVKKIKIKPAGSGKSSDTSDTSGASAYQFKKMLADDYNTVFQSPDPHKIFCFSPAICVLPSGRIITTCDFYVTDKNYKPIGYDKPQPWDEVGRVAYSDDGGKTWKYPFDAPFLFGRPFLAGGKLYLIARDTLDSRLAIYKSEDDGETWSKKSVIGDKKWHSSPTAPLYVGDYVYMTMETGGISEIAKSQGKRSGIAPVLMKAKVTDDLTKTESWTFSEPTLSYADVIDNSFTNSSLDYTGIPYYSAAVGDVGWLEGNVIQIYDKKHDWYDETGKTFYIFLRGSTIGGSPYAAIMKVTEDKDGKMTPSLVKTPSGKTQLFIPLPGGNNKFYIIYDTKTKLYWLLSSYIDDGMTSRKYLIGDRVGDASNQRDKLALYFSKNAVNWSFAGIVTAGKKENEARNYASMAIDGEDLLVVSRSGDEKSEGSHDNNLITFHRVKNFRDLVY